MHNVIYKIRATFRQSTSIVLLKKHGNISYCRKVSREKVGLQFKENTFQIQINLSIKIIYLDQLNNFIG